MAIDFDKIKRWEGFRTDVYVPTKNGKAIQQSGPTIGSGIDLGQMNEKSLNALDISDSLKEDLRPYLGKRKQEAVDFVKKNPLEFTHNEAEEITKAVHQRILDKITSRYNDQSVMQFEDLTDDQQTVIFSVGLQHGFQMNKTTPKFFGFITNQDWEGAIQELRNFTGNNPNPFERRRNEEANVLEGNTLSSLFDTGKSFLRGLVKESVEGFRDFFSDDSAERELELLNVSTTDTSQNSPRGDQSLRNQAAVLKSASNGTPVARNQELLQATGESGSQLLEMEKQFRIQEEKQLTQEAFSEALGDTPEEIQENAEAVNEIINSLDESSIQPGSSEVMYVQSLSDINTEQVTKERIATQQYLLNEIDTLWKNVSSVEKIWDAIKNFIPGKLLMDNFQLTGIINPDDAKQAVIDMIVGFRSKSPEEQRALFPIIRDELFEFLPTGKALTLLIDMVDPTQEATPENFSKLHSALDLIDVSAFGVGIAFKIASLGKKLNSIRVANELGNREVASELTAVSVVDSTGETARANGIDQVTAANNATPFNVEKIDESFTKDLAPEAQLRLNLFHQEASKSVSEISTAETFIQEGLLTSKADQINAIDRAESRFQKQILKHFGKDTPILSIDRGVVTPKGTTFTFKIKTSEGLRLNVKFDKKFTRDDVGRWQESSDSLLGQLVASPNVLAAGTNRLDDVQSAIRLDSASSVVAKQLFNLSTKAMEPIVGKGLKSLSSLKPSVRKEIAALDSILLHGDEVSEVYTTSQLRAGVNGVKLGDRQIEAYFNIRMLADSLFYIRNSAEREKAIANNIHGIQLVDGIETGKVFDTSGKASLDVAKKRIIWDDTNQVALPVNGLDLETLYEEGKRLVVLTRSKEFGEAGTFNTLLIDTSDMRKLPYQILKKKIGYVPKIAKEGTWFVKSFRGSMINGSEVENATIETIRIFDNKKDANTFRNDLRLEATIAEDSKVKYETLEDRQLEREAIGGEGIGSSSGLYTGARKGEDIPFGLDGVKLERYGAFEALQINIQNLQKNIPRNLWRIGIQQKWINTANHLIVSRRITSFRDALPDTEAGRFLDAQRKQIEDWMGFPTKSEEMWSEAVQKGYEWALSKNLNRDSLTAASINYLKHQDPVNTIRSLTFHSLLGAFNPIQLWVQAQGAALSLSTNLFRPDKIAKILKDQTALGFIQHIEDPAVISKVAKAFGKSPEEFAEIQRLWLKTGLQDSILQTADHAAAIQNFGVGADALRRAADNGLLFFRSGELFNRRIAFLTSLDEFNKGAKVVRLSDDDLKIVLTRANNLLLNLNKSNRAAWQKGPLSIPTQFMQVQTKTIESMLGLNKSFDTGDRLKIALGQVGLYGAAGIPLGNMGLRYAMEMGGLTQQDVDEMSVDTIKALNGGFWEWMVFQVGADIDISKRGALIGSIHESIIDLAIDSESPLELFAGPSFSPFNRFFDSFKKFVPFATASAINLELTTDLFTQGLSLLLSPLSSFKSSEKAVWMHYMNTIKSGSGDPLVWKDFTLATEIATAMGASPSDVQRRWDLEKLNQSVNKSVKSATDLLIHLDNKGYSILNTRDMTESEKIVYQAARAIVLQGIPTSILQKVLDAEKTRLLKGGPGNADIDKAANQFFEKFVDDLASKLIDTNRRLTQTNTPVQAED